MRKMLVSLIGLLCLLTLCLQGVQARQGDAYKDGDSDVQIDKKPFRIVATNLLGTSSQGYQGLFQALGGKAPYTWVNAEFQLSKDNQIQWLHVASIDRDLIILEGEKAPPEGNYGIRVVVEDSAKNRIASDFTIQISNRGPVPDFELTSNPTAQTISPGQKASYDIAVHNLYGFQGFGGPLIFSARTSSGLKLELSPLPGDGVHDPVKVTIITKKHTKPGVYSILVIGKFEYPYFNLGHTVVCTVIVRSQ